MIIRGKVAISTERVARSEPRRIVNIAARLRERGTQELDVIVEDISTHGCKFSPPGESEVGRIIWLKLTGLESIRCRIVWIEGDEAGCEFETQVPDTDIEFLQQQSLFRPKERVASFGRRR